jgi:D-glycero-D-manno-heptose 1,7-bisphosphate phosphatase
MRRAVFLDRDGVINRVVWRGTTPASPRTVAEFVLEPGVVDAVARLRADGYLIFVVTNQPDVRRGLLDPAVLEAIETEMRRAFAPDAILTCPHDDRDGCTCRKPKPGMLFALAANHHVDLAASWMIGDQDRDMQCGRAAGCGTIQLARDYNTGAGADYSVPDLGQAVLRACLHPHPRLTHVHHRISDQVR